MVDEVNSLTDEVSDDAWGNPAVESEEEEGFDDESIDEDEGVFGDAVTESKANNPGMGERGRERKVKD